MTDEINIENQNSDSMTWNTDTGMLRVFRSISERAREGCQRDDDYIGDDGLVHCAKCHGRKQKVLDMSKWDGGDMVVWCLCPCMTEESRKREQAQKEAEEREKREAARRELAEQLRSEYMQEEALRTATFDIYFEKVFNGDYDTRESRRIYKIANRYVEMFDQFLKDNRGLIFFGPTGTGKTFTAACIANALLSKGVPVVMTSLPKLTDSIKFDDESKSAQAILKRINRADLLIIDDLGIERMSSFAQEKAYEFINGRYEAKKPLLITTNLTIEDLTKTPSLELRRVYERITEFCHMVEFSGESLRRRRAKELFASMTTLLEGD